MTTNNDQYQTMHDDLFQVLGREAEAHLRQKAQRGSTLPIAIDRAGLVPGLILAIDAHRARLQTHLDAEVITPEFLWRLGIELAGDQEGIDLSDFDILEEVMQLRQRVADRASSRTGTARWPGELCEL
jgi:hypothetical protein